jgi:Domain of unknown function (DUF397)
MNVTEVRWFKSTRSGGNGGSCVEVAELPDAIAVRDSKNPTGPVLIFTVAEWRAFVEGVHAGEFEV